jgi:hypothetical protein
MRKLSISNTASYPQLLHHSRSLPVFYFDAESFFINATASWTVVMNWAGKTAIEAVGRAIDDERKVVPEESKPKAP